MDTEKPKRKFASFRGLLTHFSPFCQANFASNFDDNLDLIQQHSKVLVVGAGGLGCEILKNLALSGFRDLHVIDMDKVDVSNLNRQFLFREADVDHYKAEVAAKFVMRRCPDVKVEFYTNPIQEFPVSWYQAFNVVIAGLDNIEARRWLNKTLVDLVRLDPTTGEPIPDSLIPLIDGGTEAFNGQARVFMPHITSCFECSMASMTPATTYAVCTIRNVPRIPEHCIAYALKMLWPRLVSFSSAKEYVLGEKSSGDDESNAELHVPLDKDNDDHMTWLYDRARDRAEQFKIGGVTYNLTMQVVKNIIPAVGSTNAMIAASCVNECFKFMTNSGGRLNNYYMYRGAENTGIHAHTFAYERNPLCEVCQKPNFKSYSAATTLQQLLDDLKAQFNLERPSVSTGAAKPLYQTMFHDQTKLNLTKPISELFTSPTMLVVQEQTTRLKFFISYS